MIVIDTTKYSGSFEREICAYATGQIGDCGVGIDYVDDNHPYADWWLENIVMVNDNGCYRPVEICETPGYINDGMGTLYKDTEENRTIALNSGYQKLVEYYASELEMVKNRIANNDFEDKKYGWTEEACLRTVESITKTLENYKNNKRVFPAYQSVAINVSQKVPEHIWEDFCSRVYKFAENNDLEILNIRVV